MRCGRGHKGALPLAISGIRYVLDDDGNKQAVLIDLSEHGELWEDIYDLLLAEARVSEPRESLEEVKRALGFGDA